MLGRTGLQRFGRTGNIVSIFSYKISSSLTLTYDSQHFFLTFTCMVATYTFGFWIVWQKVLFSKTENRPKLLNGIRFSITFCTESDLFRIDRLIINPQRSFRLECFYFFTDENYMKVIKTNDADFRLILCRLVLSTKISLSEPKQLICKNFSDTSFLFTKRHIKLKKLSQYTYSCTLHSYRRYAYI